MKDSLNKIRKRSEDSSRLMLSFKDDFNKSLQNITDLNYSFNSIIENLKSVPEDEFFKVNANFNGKNIKTGSTHSYQKEINLNAEFRKLIIDVLENKNKITAEYSKILNNMVFIYRVAMFDGLFSDYIQTLYTYYPDALKSGKTITTEQILKLNSIDEIRNYIISKELLEFGFKSFSDQVKFIRDKFNISIESEEININQIIEAIETRNIHVHNSGIINLRYINNVTFNAQNIGEYRQISDDYINEIDYLLNKVIILLVENALNKVSK